MVHVWYIQYGDAAHNIDPSAIYEGVLAEIHKEDPDAYIEQIRQYKYQIAFYVNHPTWTEAKLRVAEERLGILSAIFFIALAIAALLAASGYVINAIVNWEKEHRLYVDRDPKTGEEVSIYGWSAYLAWLAGHRPEALANLDAFGATSWWERIFDILPIVIILIGAAIFIPLVTKLIPKHGG